MLPINKLTLLLAFILPLTALGQDTAGKAECTKGVALIAKGKHKQANKLIEEACNKGYMPACKELRFMWYASDNQRADAQRKLIAGGDKETEFGYAQVLPPDSFARKVQILTRLGESGYKAASLQLGDLYAGQTPIHDTAIAVRIYRYWAAQSDTVAWAKMAMIQNNDKNLLYYLATVFESKPWGNKSKEEKNIRFENLYRQASALGDGRASYWLGHLHVASNGLSLPEEADRWYKLAQKQGFSVPESELSYVAWALSPEGRKVQDEIEERRYRNALNNRNIPEPAKARSSATTAVTRKTCPVCNGTGKVKDTYTSEKRDWDNKTITMTDHTISRSCSRCNGKGYYEY